MEVSNILDFWEKEHLSVGSPKYNDLVALSFLVLNVLSELINTFLIGAREDIVDAIRLVCSNELLIEDSWERNNLLKVLLESIDKCWLENMSSLAGLVQVQV